MQVPNKFPTIESNLRLALIGEAPGRDEVVAGEPFVGPSGRFLAALMSKAGLSKSACFLGNVSQYQPPNNKIELFEWDGYEIRDGLEQLKKDICQFNPNIVVLLGNVPLKAAKDPFSKHPLKPNSYQFKNSQWRGSLFTATSGPFEGRKCISTYHPAYVLRDYEAAPLLSFDLKKAVNESGHPSLRLPVRMLKTDLSLGDLIESLRQIRKDKLLVALDIEGGIDTMSCISFATLPCMAFIVPFLKNNGQPYWGPLEEQLLLRELTLTLEDPNVPKVLQNSLYDTFVLQYSYGIRIRNVVDDTMLKSWSLYCELEKKLGVLASIYTNEPFYKGERKADDEKTFYEYCCKDSAVTIEINEYLEPRVKGVAKEHYRFNVNMLLPLRYMEMRGIRYDVQRAKERRTLLQQKMFEAQAQLNGMTGFGFEWKSCKAIDAHMQANFFTKKGDRLLKDYTDVHPRIQSLLHQMNPSMATLGEIEDLCEVSLNVSSNKLLIPYLYETLKLPVQYNDSKEKPAPTADYEALLNLSAYCEKSEQPEKKAIVQKIIEIRSLATRERMLGIECDGDGRIRCGYNIVGSETGRITCYTSPTGSGYNLQTIPKYTDVKEAPGGVLGDRDLFIADEGYWLFQCDLEGADGWTVAAYCKMLGDDTMFEDYKAGLRPAKILVLLLNGERLDYNDREALKDACKKISKDDWNYFACKRVQHGANYLEGPRTIGRNILTDSEGKLVLSEGECRRLRDLYFARYRGIQLWHRWVGRQLAARPILTAASGQIRQFFGRPDEILTKAVAFEPQANTTYATNKAMWNLWTDVDNRKSVDGIATYTRGMGLDTQKLGNLCSASGLRIEPLHQVHDALIGQFRKEDTTWAIGKIKQWFNNPLQIAGQTIVIPFEGGYGRSWLEQKEGKI